MVLYDSVRSVSLFNLDLHPLNILLLKYIITVLAA